MKPRKPLLAFLIVISLFLFFIFSKKQEVKKEANIIPSSKAFSVILSGDVQGLALVSQDSNKIKVNVNVTSLDPLSAFIESGDCKTKGERLYPLNKIESGKSETSVNAPLGDLLQKKPLSIKIYKDLLVSCGELVFPN